MASETLKNLTLLYVEDDDEVRRNAVEYLSRLCREVFEAHDGREAIRVWREKHPDIIIADIRMPRLNGLDMAAYIRAHDSKVQIIIATAYTDKEYLMQAVELQLVKYLVKPITKEKLLGALEKSLLQIEDKSRFSFSLTDECVFDAYSNLIVCGERETKLSKKEGLFLSLLARHHTRTVHYEEIENAVWPDEGMSQDAIRSLVRALRKKLPEGMIENVSGVGYRLKVAPPASGDDRS
jgi:DNA-binding response OmpR family regulator